MIYLSLEEILAGHDYQISRFGGTEGIRDIRMLESAVLRPQTTFDGKDLYESVYEKAAVLCFSLIKNHPFTDGNKRTGLYAMLTFLRINGIYIKTDQEALVDLALDIATGKADTKEIISILKKNTR